MKIYRIRKISEDLKLDSSLPEELNRIQNDAYLEFATELSATLNSYGYETVEVNTQKELEDSYTSNILLQVICVKSGSEDRYSFVLNKDGRMFVVSISEEGQSKILSHSGKTLKEVLKDIKDNFKM